MRPRYITSLGVSLIAVGFSVAHAPSSAKGNASRQLSSPKQPSLADAMDDLPTCKWVHSTVDDALVKANCASTQRPIAGGCHTDIGSAKLEESFAFENSDATDLVNNSTAWYSTGNTAGWACEFSTSAGGTNTAIALCCGD
jgi:hypothetical protein